MENLKTLTVEEKTEFKRQMQEYCPKWAKRVNYDLSYQYVTHVPDRTFNGYYEFLEVSFANGKLIIKERGYGYE